MPQGHASGGASRRAFLASAGLAAAAPVATPVWEAASGIQKDRKLDSHCHVMLSRGHTARAVVEAADRLHIERMVISLPRGATPEGFRESNDIILKAMKEFPDRFLGQCFLNPAYPRQAMEEMKRCMDLGMVGLGELYDQVKIHDPRYDAFFEKSIEMKAPILMHARGDLGLTRPGYRLDAPTTTSAPSDFVEAARRYPEAILIHAHIGGGGDWELMCKTLQDSPSVYVDTSGSVTDEGMIDFALRYLGPERLLFATDLNFESGVGKILAANLTEAQRSMIFFDNYNNILRRRGLHAR